MKKETKVTITAEARRAFAATGRAGGIKSAGNLTAKQRRARAQKAAAASAKVRKEKADRRK
jgi:hypothetical protein